MIRELVLFSDIVEIYRINMEMTNIANVASKINKVLIRSLYTPEPGSKTLITLMVSSTR